MPNDLVESDVHIEAAQVPEIIKALAKRWYIVIAGIVVGLLVAIQSLQGGPTFESSITIAPSQGASSGDAANGTLSGLASLAGVGGASQTLSPYEQLLLTFKSAELANAVFADKPLLREIFASRWDPVHRVWKTNTSTLSAIAHNIDESFGVWRPRELGSDDVLAYLTKDVKIVTDKTTSVRVISLRTPNPKTSYDIISALYHQADSLVRRSDASFINEQVNYLEHRLDTVANAEHRQQLALILSDYEKRLMLAQGRANYAARVVDQPQIPRVPASPRPIIVLVLGGLVGGTLATVILTFIAVRKGVLTQSMITEISLIRR